MRRSDLFSAVELHNLKLHVTMIGQHYWLTCRQAPRIWELRKSTREKELALRPVPGWNLNKGFWKMRRSEILEVPQASAASFPWTLHSSRSLRPGNALMSALDTGIISRANGTPDHENELRFSGFFVTQCHANYPTGLNSPVKYSITTMASTKSIVLQLTIKPENRPQFLITFTLIFGSVALQLWRQGLKLCVFVIQMSFNNHPCMLVD